MLTKESKLRVMENFYSIDYALFGKSVKQIDTCCPETIREFITVKGALLSVMVEMYKLLDHKPSVLSEKVDIKQLKQIAVESAKVARNNSKVLVASDEGKQSVKEALQQKIEEAKEKDDIDMMVEDTIRNKAFGIAIDNLLIARTLSECEDVSPMNEWEGLILEDAYKILRDSLVEVASFIDEYAAIK